MCVWSHQLHYQPPSVNKIQDLTNTPESLSKGVSEEIKTEEIENEGPQMIPYFDRIENISGKSNVSAIIRISAIHKSSKLLDIHVSNYGY